MLKRLVLSSPYRELNERDVAREVNNIQKQGYEVIEVKKVKKMVWIFGSEVTDIYYKK